jgi:hypothetical protein
MVIYATLTRSLGQFTIQDPIQDGKLGRNLLKNSFPVLMNTVLSYA